MSLIQMSISATILVVVIIILRALLIHKLPKRTFMILWMLVLFRLIVPLSIPSIFSIYSWIPSNTLWEERTSEILTENPNPNFVMNNHLPYQEDGEQKVENQTQNVLSVENLQLILKLVWLIGFSVCGAFFTIVYRKGKCKFQSSNLVESEYIDEWKRKHPLWRKFSIRKCDRISAPLSYGLLHPVILLSENTDMKNEKELEYILTHEYVHIKRLDVLSKAFMITGLCVHWFNPMIWIMYILFNRDMELACDEAVVRIFGEESKASYARTLIDMQIQQAAIMPLCNNFSKNAIEERIGAIMKTKKTSAFVIAMATALIVGVTIGFATSGVTNREETSIISTALSKEEIDKILALKFDGYEKMSILEYQDKVWKMTDTMEYQNLIDRISKNKSFFEQKDSDSIASFFFNVVEPLSAEKWQSREFGGYIQTNYTQTSDNAVLEYSFVMNVKNPQTLTVGEYDKTRLRIKMELDKLIRNKTPQQLQDEDYMNNMIHSELKNIEKRYSSNKLQISLEYDYKPLLEIEIGNTENNLSREPEKRAYPNATKKDYLSLFALKTADYKKMSVSNFNKKLMEWANEDYERSERIGLDSAQGNYAIPLSKEEKNFVELTVWASGMENAEFVRSHHTSKPEQNPIFYVELPNKEKHLNNEIVAWCSAGYQLSYQIKNKDILTIGERDRYLNNVLTSIKKFWDDIEIDEILKMDKAEIEKNFKEISVRNSNEKMKFDIVKEQVYFEHGNEGNFETKTVLFVNDGNKEIISENGGEWISASEWEKRHPKLETKVYTYEEYKEWLDKEKVELRKLIGSGEKYKNKNGEWVEWTREEVERTIKMYEQTLEDIKNGIEHGEMKNDDGSMIGYAMIKGDASVESVENSTYYYSDEKQERAATKKSIFRIRKIRTDLR